MGLSGGGVEEAERGTEHWELGALAPDDEGAKQPSQARASELHGRAVHWALEAESNPPPMSS
eukprot:427113-Prymnesium_polylepis.1